MRIDVTERWIPTQEEFDLFARVSGDDNPIHVDPAFSAHTTFGRTVSHGMLIYAKLWGMARRAAPDATHEAQQMMFPNPTYAGDVVDLSVAGAAPGRLVLTARRVADGAELLMGELVAGP